MTTGGDEDASRPLSEIGRRRRKRLAALERYERHVPVNFAVVGVQKAATSSTYMMLARHRLVARGPEKEMRVFMKEHLDWPDPDLSEYMRPATTQHAQRAGDATPEYLFWPHALERMQRYDAGMPLVAIFRDPIERAFSQWSMQRTRDAEFPDVPETIARWAEDHVPEELPPRLPLLEVRRRSLYTRGLYGQQLERGLGLFPRKQWLLLDFEEVTNEPHRTLDRLTDHLDIHRFRKYPVQAHRNQTARDHVGDPPSVADIQRLVDMYADDLRLFEKLSGLDIGRWSTSRVLAGELSVADFRDTLTRKLGLPV